MTLPIRRLLMTFVVLLGCTCAPAAAQTSADLFADDTVQTLQVTIHSRDWQDLRANFTASDFYPCDVTWNGIRVQNAAVRSRGMGSRSGVKPGLELSFDHYVRNQRFVGLESVVLDNLITDASMIRERAAMALLRRLGVAAPREVHAKLYVNGEYAGLYAIVESVDSSFVQRAFGANASAGTLYEYRWTYPYYATYLGDNLDSYRTLFALRGDSLKSTFDLYDPIRELLRAVNESPDETFASAVDARLNLDEFIRIAAADAFLAEWDGLLGYAGMNNFYLYRDAAGRGHLVPWDKDHSFYAADYPVLAGAQENVLMRRALNDPGLRAAVYDRIAEAAQAAAEDGWLEREIWRMYDQIRDDAAADTIKLSSTDEFTQAVTELLSFARTRPGFVLAEVTRLRSAP